MCLRPHNKIGQIANDGFDGFIQLRSHSPDVTVAVGQGNAMQEFECHKIALAFASPYFDAMFCADMREKTSGLVELPDKDPEEWKLFYWFIDPGQIRATKKAQPCVGEENVMTLTPWFHEFQMESYLSECDDIIAAIIKDMSKKGDSCWQKQVVGQQEPAVQEREARFNKIIDLLHFASTYNLKKSQCKTESAHQLFMTNLRGESAGLLGASAIQKLLDLTLPLEELKDGNGRGPSSQRESRQCSGFVSRFFCPKELPLLLLETVNDKATLTCLIHVHFRTYLKGEVEKREILSVTKTVNALIESDPDRLFDSLNGYSTRNCKVSAARHRAYKIRVHTLARQNELFEKLGIHEFDYN